jgi:undecaprenyl diphosphate synthase
MDGNGRWAERRGQPRVAGHLAGARAARTVITKCRERGVAHVTLYAFSSDNWGRPAAEVDALMSLLTRFLRSEARALADADIRVTIIGTRTRLPVTLLRAIEQIESRTAHASAMQLSIAIDYSSRAAIESNALRPAVDLLIRTGGERRLSDFLLWECAYAELLFLDVLWPALTAADLDAAFRDFASRDRRFGRLSLTATPKAS